MDTQRAITFFCIEPQIKAYFGDEGSVMRLEFAKNEIEELVRQVVAEVMVAIDWPQGRLALDEAEAAKSPCVIMQLTLQSPFSGFGGCVFGGSSERCA
jgi:hypothetical protein